MSPATHGLSVPNNLEALAIAREDVRARLAESGVDDRAVYAVDLVLEELVGNTIRYGYDADADGEGVIEVRLVVQPTRVRVELVDDGRAFDPTDYPDPPAQRTLSESAVGGRGIAMVRRTVRALEYRRADGRNVVAADVGRQVEKLAE